MICQDTPSFLRNVRGTVFYWEGNHASVADNGLHYSFDASGVFIETPEAFSDLLVELHADGQFPYGLLVRWLGLLEY